MTGPEHYREAEKILTAINRRTASDELLHVREQRLELQAKAHVHATLALAAAVAVNNGGGGMAAADYNAWHQAASEKEKLREAAS